VNAFVDLVGIVNVGLDKENERRFFSVTITTYAGKNGNKLKYQTPNVQHLLCPTTNRAVEAS
jgi:hypothetical protein